MYAPLCESLVTHAVVATVHESRANRIEGSFKNRRDKKRVELRVHVGRAIACVSRIGEDGYPALFVSLL